MMFEHDNMDTAVINKTYLKIQSYTVYSFIKTITHISHPGYAGMAGCGRAARTALYTGRPRPLR